MFAAGVSTMNVRVVIRRTANLTWQCRHFSHTTKDKNLFPWRNLGGQMRITITERSYWVEDNLFKLDLFSNLVQVGDLSIWKLSVFQIRASCVLLVDEHKLTSADHSFLKSFCFWSFCGKLFLWQTVRCVRDKYTDVYCLWNLCCNLLSQISLVRVIFTLETGGLRWKKPFQTQRRIYSQTLPFECSCKLFPFYHSFLRSQRDKFAIWKNPRTVAMKFLLPR